MALKARPAAAAPAPLPYNWTGLYVGIQGGAGWGHAEDTDATPFDSGRFAVRGGLIGGSLGYNWQLSNVVLALEGDDAAAWIKGSTVGTLPIPTAIAAACLRIAIRTSVHSAHSAAASAGPSTGTCLT